MSMRSIPLGVPYEDTSVGTTGEAFAIPLSSASPFVVATSVKVYVSALARVGFGVGDADDQPDDPDDASTAYQEAGTEEVYTLSGKETDFDHVWVWAATGTITARLSFFG